MLRNTFYVIRCLDERSIARGNTTEGGEIWADEDGIPDVGDRESKAVTGGRKALGCFTAAAATPGSGKKKKTKNKNKKTKQNKIVEETTRCCSSVWMDNVCSFLHGLQ